MKKIVLALMFVSTIVNAQTVERFDAGKNVTRKSTVTWEVADNVVEACNAKRKSYGLPSYKQPSMACSFWTDNTCHIITARNTDHDTIGHEMRHCFAGKFH